MHPVPSEAVPFVYLASVCWSLQCLISTLTQVGGGGLLFGLLVPSRCWEGLALLTPLRCSGSRLLYMERALHCARFQPSGAPQKRGTKSCACVLCLPGQSGSGSQELAGHPLPGAARLLPLQPQPQSSPAPVGCLCPVSRSDPPGRCRTSRISGSLWVETRGLFAVW